MRVYAIIVLFNPEKEKLIRNLNAILPQVEKVILVDNASHKQSVMDEICLKYCNCHLIRNCENFGIAKALNQGIKYAEDAGAEWVVTLDQDSECSPVMIDEYKKYIMNKDVGILCPIVIDRYAVLLKRIGGEMEEIDSCITSGNLLRIKAWEEAGRFQEELFIDFVDFDFCKRLKETGYKIYRVNRTTMLQETGKSGSKNKLLWKTTITGNHTTIRKYYIFRNWHYYITRYEKGMDRIRQYYRMMKFAVKVVIYETDKKEKGMAMFQGYTDAKKLKKEINEKNIHGEDGK